jgi:hypothetical protein
MGMAGKPDELREMAPDKLNLERSIGEKHGM